MYYPCRSRSLSRCRTWSPYLCRRLFNDHRWRRFHFCRSIGRLRELICLWRWRWTFLLDRSCLARLLKWGRLRICSPCALLWGWLRAIGLLCGLGRLWRKCRRGLNCRAFPSCIDDKGQVGKGLVVWTILLRRFLTVIREFRGWHFPLWFC